MPLPDNMKQITECALALIEKQDKMEQKKNYKTEQVKPQVNGQRVTFDQNGELVVLTNKGKLDAKGNQQVFLDGIFTINARDLAKILSAITEVKFVEKSYFRGHDGSLITFFNPAKDVQDLTQEVARLEKSEQESYQEALDSQNKLALCRVYIDDFNRSRRIWERKFEKAREIWADK